MRSCHGWIQSILAVYTVCLVSFHTCCFEAFLDLYESLKPLASFGPTFQKVASVSGDYREAVAEIYTQSAEERLFKSHFKASILQLKALQHKELRLQSCDIRRVRSLDSASCNPAEHRTRCNILANQSSQIHVL
jgi:hypothetical protein